MTNTRLDEFLHDNLSISPKVELDEDCGIVTSCGKKHFVGFQLFYTSLVKTHRNTNLLVYELEGDELSDSQRKWMQHNEIRTEFIPRSEFIAPHDLWLVLNKPLCLWKSPFRRTFWMDSDQIILRSTANLFGHIYKMPFVATNTLLMPNQPGIFDYVDVKSKCNDFILSTSVVGYDKHKPEQVELIKQWVELTKFVTFHEKNLIRFIANFDEGLMRLTLQKLGKQNTEWVWPDLNWSWPVLPAHRHNNIYHDIHSIRHRFTDANIIHFTSVPKIFEGCGELLDINPLKDC